MVAISCYHAVLTRRQRGLQPNRHRFLSDVQMAETTNKTKAIKLPCLFLKSSDKKHVAVELQKLFLVRFIRLRLIRTLAVGAGCILANTGLFR